jgi:putative Mg2+ transporter-C (MgtC) family protein
MSLFDQAQAVFLILLAAGLSMVIGLDRERRDHPAGLRTHMLVGVGACLFTMLSTHAFGSDADSARVASQILPGIGFLGAGAILKEKAHVKGLTTAASIWATAAVGMAVGTGSWLLAVGVTVIIWFILSVLHRFESHNTRRAKGAELADPANNNRSNDEPGRPSSPSSWAE